MSTAPPAAYGTTILIGRSGYTWAWTIVGTIATASANPETQGGSLYKERIARILSILKVQ
jgi:hypothetical protein